MTCIALFSPSCVLEKIYISFVMLRINRDKRTKTIWDVQKKKTPVSIDQTYVEKKMNWI